MITKITFEDYQELEEIGKESLPIYYNMQDIFLLNTIENKIMLKCVIDNKIIGFIFCCEEENNIHINSFAIKKDYREKGYGKKLIDHIKNYKKNITLNVLETNEIAINFYKKQNFILKEIKQNYYEHLENKNALFFQYCIQKL
jgi:ribosomal-protein-alanine N-acetyltransferase